MKQRRSINNQLLKLQLQEQEAQATIQTNQKCCTIYKNGTDIQVTNPEVVIDQSKGTGKYQGFTVEYKNIRFPDDMQD